MKPSIRYTGQEHGMIQRTTHRGVHPFESVPRESWYDWRWQLQHRISTAAQLFEYFDIPESDHEEYRQAMDTWRCAITPYYLSLIDRSDDRDPLRCQCVPQLEEWTQREVGSDDPLCEERDMPVTNLIHRYHDRCLTMVTDACAVYCRHCNRKRRWCDGEPAPSRDGFQQMIEYVGRTPEVREVIISGGDPLMLKLDTLEWFIKSLRVIRHVEIIRIGSRVPVVLPMRITSGLCRMLRKYRPLWFMTQFNHSNEITDEAARACEMLLQAGIPVMNQSVLLKGVNDTAAAMRELLYGLERIAVKPYYLFQCEPVRGVEHFRVDVARGVELMEQLRGTMSGLCMPNYVYDLPGGRGKMPLHPCGLYPDAAQEFDNKRQID